MKRKNTKKNLEKFTKVNTHKRKAKEQRKMEIIRALNEIQIKHDGFTYRESANTGRKGRERKEGAINTILGVYSGTKSGFGFVSAEGLDCADIFIPEGKSGGAIDGDFVECVYRRYKNYLGEDKTEGRISKIIKAGREFIIGELVCENSYMRGRHRVDKAFYLIPDDTKLSLRPVVTYTAGAKEGEKVAVKIKRGSGTPYSPEAEVVTVYGDCMSREANYGAILDECEIPTEFSERELLDAEGAAASPLSDADRVRYPGRVIFTIDGEGAKDLDDAVSLKKIKGGWQLGVHIADVSTYVKEKSALDRCVLKRGTSVYFTDKVVPMLPPVLSNGVCSLHPGKDKYVLSAIITLDSDGNIKDTRIEKGIIRSRVRGVYSEVNRIFAKEADSELLRKYREAMPSLERMRELYSVLDRRARLRGSLELEIREAAVVLNDDGEPCDIIRRERGIAERMIEQFMLTANEAVARLLKSRGIPCVYRVHASPPEDKLRDFLTFAHNLGFDTGFVSLTEAEPRDLSRLLDEAEKRGLLSPVSYMMLRSMSKAEYSEACSRHFGLSIDEYCHFTSPIRRLSDLATHRIIHAVLLGGARAEAYSGYAKRAARIASETEVRAVTAERRIENLYKVIYMSNYLGEEFTATVSSVTQFGLFAELDNTCEGLIPISDMPGFFTFDEKNMTVRGSGLVYHLGDSIRVKLEEADIRSGKLRFSLVL